MKKLEIIIKPEKLESLKNILDDCEASGLMITNIMGYGNQKGYTRMYRGTTYNVNLLPKVKVETVVADDAAGNAGQGRPKQFYKMYAGQPCGSQWQGSGCCGSRNYWT